MDLQLRDECRNLLTRLRVSQTSMKHQLESSKQLEPQCTQNDDYSLSKFGKDITGTVNVSHEADTDLKPTYARSKLLSVCKSTNQKDVCDISAINLKDKENQNTCDYFSTGESVKNLNPVKSVSGMNPLINQPSTTAASPSRIWKRQLINKHTAVPSTLNPEELKELDDERLLNFNYSNINVDTRSEIKSLRPINQIDHKERTSKVVQKQFDSESSQSMKSSDDFRNQLQDEGNDRRFNNWVKETTVEPKTLLNSSHYYSLAKKKSNSRVRFNSASNNEEMPVADQRLLGYDWIAALLDNEETMVDQSESFFDGICDFRKAFKEECNNKFYMESPYTLVDSEPEPVVQALTDPKVRPFVVNERLFTEPLNSDLIEDTCDIESKKSPSKSKEPTKENPRFVRVSIPRSTLQTPYRVKPHRRGSFDGSDSCALMDHCLLGWENTVPSSIPPAKSLSLACDAGTQINSQTTTLAEAERLATLSNQVQWHLSKPSSQAHILPRWRKHYMDTTLNLSLPSNLQHSANMSSTLNQSATGGGPRGDVKRTTDRILQSTYSTMYEMERLRKERELEKY